jgi:hypothetical protein
VASASLDSCSRSTHKCSNIKAAFKKEAAGKKNKNKKKY